MAKPQQHQQPSVSECNNSEPKYKGVRKRKWGKWVSEVRLPNSRERIWLGSYDSPRKAARAFDAALYCLRGPAARFNFPDEPPSPGVIGGGRSLSPQEIQAVAAQHANNYHRATRGEEEEEEDGARRTTTLSPRDGNGNGKGSYYYSNTTSDEDEPGAVGPTTSSATTAASQTSTIDWSFLEMLNSSGDQLLQPPLLHEGTAAAVAAATDHHFELFSGMDNMNMSMNMNMGGGDYYHDPHHMISDGNDVINNNNNDHYYHHDEMAGNIEPYNSQPSSFLWNF